MERVEDDAWGIHIADASKEYVLFYGSSYNAAEPNNITVQYPDTVSLSPDGDITFAAITGVPSTSATLTATSNTAGLTESITINEEGNIQRD